MTGKPKRVVLELDELFHLAGDVAKRGAGFEIRTSGHSMYPQICHDDCVCIGPLAPSGPTIGDVVLAATPEGPRLHRLVGIEYSEGGRRWLLKGDAERKPTARIWQEDIRARVVAVRRPLARWLSPLFVLRFAASRLETWLLKLRHSRKVSKSK